MTYTSKFTGPAIDLALTTYENTIDVIGNSIAAASANPTIGNITYQYATSIGASLCAALGQRIKMGSTFAEGGITSSTVVTDYLQSFLDSKSKYGLFVPFENDILGITLEQSIINAEKIISDCSEYNKIAVFLGPLPSLSFTTTEARDKYYGLSNSIAELCSEYGFPYCNGFNLYGNYASAYPQPIAGFTDASVHPSASTVINQIVKQGLLPIFNVLCPEFKGYPVGGPSAYNGAGNPGFNGTGGLLGTNASGVCPDSWTANAYGAGNAGVFSVEPSSDTDDKSPWLQCVYTGSTAGTISIVSPSQVISGSQFAVGDTIRATMEMEVLAGGTGCENMDLWIFFVGPNTYVYSNVDTLGTMAENPGRLVISSPSVTIPAGTSSFNIYGRFRSSGTFNFSARIRHPSVIKQDL